VKSVITPEHFPILSEPFLASTPVTSSNRVEEITKLAELRDIGVLTDVQFKKAVRAVIR
jgi:hypothetical protein